jgi:hypothetical protein
MPYDRYLELHLVASDKQYDFVTNIEAQRDYQTLKLEMGQGEVQRASFLDPMWPSYASYTSTGKAYVNRHDSELPPTRGLVHCPIYCGEVRNPENQPNEICRRVVAWVSDAYYVGKIRLNAHGDPGGVIYMRDRDRKKDQVSGTQFAQFLVKCGLGCEQRWLKSPRGRPLGISERSGVVTICLCICYGACAVSNSLNAMQQVAAVLNEKRLFGIDVTGADKEVEVLGFEGDHEHEGGDGDYTVYWKDLNKMSKEEIVQQIKQKGTEILSGKNSKGKTLSRTLSQEYRGLFDQVMKSQSVTASMKDLKMLLAECWRVTDFRTNTVYPMGAKQGQWGVTVNNTATGVETWVRVHDPTSHKFKIRSARTS